IHGVRAQDSDKPFFVYFSTGCSHAPHHVAASWADRYKGQFDQGWDKLREETFARQKELGVVPAEAELTPRDAAFPAWDDVMDKWSAQIMDPHYGAAWAWAGNTAFKWGKQVGSHLGGTRNPMVVRWPERITDAGGLRPQFGHVIDVAPTILDLAGIPQPQTVD